jgi:hypothetical protein
VNTYSFTVSFGRDPFSSGNDAVLQLTVFAAWSQSQSAALQRPHSSTGNSVHQLVMNKRYAGQQCRMAKLLELLERVQTFAMFTASSTYSANPQLSSFSAVTGPVETHAFSTWN